MMKLLFKNLKKQLLTPLPLQIVEIPIYSFKSQNFLTKTTRKNKLKFRSLDDLLKNMKNFLKKNFLQLFKL